MLGLCVLIFMLAIPCYRQINSTAGKAFLIANSAMPIVSVYLYAEGYYFFAVLGPRVIHDATAFIFYMVHDYNRHHEAPRNGLYKVLNKLRLSAFWSVPLIAILLTCVLQVYGNSAF